VYLALHRVPGFGDGIALMSWPALQYVSGRPFRPVIVAGAQPPFYTPFPANFLDMDRAGFRSVGSGYSGGHAYAG
jgi:hypothetical protein